MAAEPSAKPQPQPQEALQQGGPPETVPAQDQGRGNARSQATELEPSRAAADHTPEPHAENRSQFASLRRWLWAAPSWLVSMLLHVVVLVVLAMTTIPRAQSQVQQLIVSPPGDSRLEEIEDVVEQPFEPMEMVKMEPVPVADGSGNPNAALDIGTFDEPMAAASVELDNIGLEKAPLTSDLLSAAGAFSGDALAGRGAGKGLLVAQAGGNQHSEEAVALALKWLAAHQMPDGGWNYRHDAASKCRGDCRNPGILSQARIAATGMALLPFLGAGQTHVEGKYKKEVKGGVYFLLRQMQVSRQGGSLHEPGGRMYGHGIASIALCEAYAMTRDRNLQTAAQQVINYICYAQDPVGGGWRYSPQQPGDTSVVGWQIMALKSGHLSYLRVPPVVVQKASMFLDSVQADGGARYGYTMPPDPVAEARRQRSRWEATTAIGLLCRMYLGWKKDNAALEKGVAWLSQVGPSQTNLYYDYYATQVMRHWEGDLWKNWNQQMRDYLVQTQAKKGHETGSWYIDSNHAAKGGRLYCTAMATMILEVYYRHMPIYRAKSTEDSFPLD